MATANSFFLSLSFRLSARNLATQKGQSIRSRKVPFFGKISAKTSWFPKLVAQLADNANRRKKEDAPWAFKNRKLFQRFRIRRRKDGEATGETSFIPRAFERCLQKKGKEIFTLATEPMTRTYSMETKEHFDSILFSYAFFQLRFKMKRAHVSKTKLLWAKLVQEIMSTRVYMLTTTRDIAITNRHSFYATISCAQ